LRKTKTIHTFAPKKNSMRRLVLENKTDIINQIRGYLESSSEAKFIQRLQVILLFAGKANESCDSIGALSGHSPRSISNWIKRVNRSGHIESLRSIRNPGRSPRLTKAQKAGIKKVIEESPEKCGMKGMRWSGKNLSLYISRQYGITLRDRSCQRLIHELGVMDAPLRCKRSKKTGLKTFG
jgi:transposase